MNDHEIEELLGAYALDAVDDDERRVVDAYIATNPRAREEVTLHREVATRLAFSGAPAPAGLWDRIAASLEEQPPSAAVGLAPVTSLLEQRRRRRRWVVGSLSAAAAAVVAIAFLSVEVVHLNDKVERSAAGDPLGRGAVAAMSDPSAHITDLASKDGAYDVTAVVQADGTGYLVPHKLPPAADGHTYQLWGVSGKNVVSLGVLGASPSVVSFHTDGKLDALAVTEEQAGGVAVSKQAPVAVGSLS